MTQISTRNYHGLFLKFLIVSIDAKKSPKKLCDLNDFGKT